MILKKARDLHSTLHERVARQVLHDSRDLPLAAKLDPMRALAVRYAVSLVTIREALLLLEQEGWLELKHGKGCYVRRSQTPDRHIAILVELDILRPGTSPFFLSIVNRLRWIFSHRQQSFRLHIGHATEPEHAFGDPTCHGFLDDVENDHVSGVVAVATLPRLKLVTPLRKRNIPSVGMDINGFDGTVSLDYRQMLREGAGILIRQGCRRLAMVGDCLTGANADIDENAFEQEIRQNGLVYRPEWVRTTLTTSHRGTGWDDFIGAWNARKEKPDGLLINDDMLLADVDLAIRAMNIQVPQQLKVVLATSRNIPHNASFPLTRLENQPEAMADAMAELLFTLMARREPEERHQVFGYQPEPVTTVANP
jgi:DNA-binding LacI/PurR family transcriptional regulator